MKLLINEKLITLVEDKNFNGAFEYIGRFLGEDLKPKKYGDIENLKVVEIPAGSKYFVDDYDGMESVILESEVSWEIAEV